ncbi:MULTISPECIES: ABC transporter permease [Chroococcidiopsis]|jgi:peptide/nickel transport system permease protein|uniref:Binding-protein-dependent transport systems inner membrane component n=1 Tax=Chroococcidiopsis thermalis (strain PCC 7203) TaxID=251229 RepID=K9TZ93_CHRTP|nr:MULTISPECIES: ABC transporter permease [Chroococcidiopsis]AFY87501.1 binding-protein-dependent transport systems inner membrane component [Chroococcidiopsis thermalis PCC 7203]PSB46185.1 ABC transporter permease [Cyanosarcina cf. burmensis CCALA 770]URD52393.1 ABC transporter permease [Chroococcidiopsis sp. CCNUC1]
MASSKLSLTSGRQWLTGIASSETFIYIIKRLAQALLTLLLASALSFFIIQLAPGDYLDTLRQNPKISPERIEQLRQQFGLDRPWIEQYFRWLWRIVTQGDFGTSFVYQRSVSSLLWERVGATLLLAISSLIVTWAIAIPLGIVAAVKQNQWSDRVLQVISYTGQGFPSFITALLLLIFAQNVSPLFPVGDMTSINHADLTPLGKILDVGWHMILPTIALSITSFAGLQRIARGELLDVLRQDYIQTARAKGLPENRVIYVHALRNAINPLITILGFELAGLLSGAFIAEFFFNWPGLGRLILQAVLAQDLYLVMASLVMGAVMLIVGNLIADLLLKVADPRIKLENP